MKEFLQLVSAAAVFMLPITSHGAQSKAALDA